MMPIEDRTYTTPGALFTKKSGMILFVAHQLDFALKALETSNGWFCRLHVSLHISYTHKCNKCLLPRCALQLINQTPLLKSIFSTNGNPCMSWYGKCQIPHKLPCVFVSPPSLYGEGQPERRFFLNHSAPSMESLSAPRWKETIPGCNVLLQKLLQGDWCNSLCSVTWETNCS